MSLGAFSISLDVKNIEASKEFYEKIGFVQIGGNIEEKWLIMKSPDAIVGLFEGMLGENILTFNPGWDENGANVDSFKDIRELESEFKSKNVEFASPLEGGEKGPASLMIVDPDGNKILLDQHR